MYSANQIPSIPGAAPTLPLYFGQPLGQQPVPQSNLTPAPMYGAYAPQRSSPYQIHYTVPANGAIPAPYGFVSYPAVLAPAQAVNPQAQWSQNTVPPARPAPSVAPSAVPSQTTAQTPSNWAAFNAESIQEPVKYPELARFDDPFELKEIPAIPASNNNNAVKEVTPQESSGQNIVHPKRCKRCSKYYVDSEPSECRFHPGQYKCWYSSKMMAGRISTWTCCKSDERGARGCKALTSHIECEQTSAALSQWDNLSSVPKRDRVPEARNFKPTPRDSLSPFFDEEKEEFIDPSVDLSVNVKSFRIKPEPTKLPEGSVHSLDPDTQLVMENGQQLIKHIVKYTDTLRGLSLKYQVSPEEIKSINKIVKDEDIWSRHTILVPYNGQTLKELDENEKERYRDEMRKRLVRRFMKMAKCGIESEALYYLQMSGFKLEDAVAEYREDVKWEAENRHVQFTSIKA